MQKKEFIGIIEQHVAVYNLPHEIDKIINASSSLVCIAISQKITRDLIKNIVLYCLFKYYYNFFKENKKEMICIQLQMKIREQFNEISYYMSKIKKKLQNQHFFQFLVAVKVCRAFVIKFLPKVFHSLQEEVYFTVVIYICHGKMLSPKAYEMLNKQFLDKTNPFPLKSIKSVKLIHHFKERKKAAVPLTQELYNFHRQISKSLKVKKCEFKSSAQIPLNNAKQKDPSLEYHKSHLKFRKISLSLEQNFKMEPHVAKLHDNIQRSKLTYSNNKYAQLKYSEMKVLFQSESPQSKTILYKEEKPFQETQKCKRAISLSSQKVSLSSNANEIRRLAFAETKILDRTLKTIKNSKNLRKQLISLDLK